MSEPRHILEVKKKQIEKNLLALVALVKDAMEKAALCLTDADQAVCKLLVENDVQINECRRLVENDCLMAVALHQPVAHDLRDIVTATRIAVDLERIGDYVSDIASIVIQMRGADLSKVGLENVQKMLSLAVNMLEEVLAAYLERDVDKAKKAAAMDDVLDAEQAQLIDQLFSTMQSSPETVPNASRMLWISHNLERCGDRATNIAEHIVFMQEAEVVELD